jgi:hypothetical protein
VRVDGGRAVGGLLAVDGFVVEIGMAGVRGGRQPGLPMAVRYGLLMCLRHDD